MLEGEPERKAPARSRKFDAVIPQKCASSTETTRGMKVLQTVLNGRAKREKQREMVVWPRVMLLMIMTCGQQRRQLYFEKKCDVEVYYTSTSTPCTSHAQRLRAVHGRCVACPRRVRGVSEAVRGWCAGLGGQLLPDS